MSEVSVKETKELFEGLGLLAKTVKEVAKDGKVDFSDASHLLELTKSANVLIEAVKGLNNIPAEVKDLKQEELLELVMLVYKHVVDVQEA